MTIMAMLPPRPGSPYYWRRRISERFINRRIPKTTNTIPATGKMARAPR